MRTSSIRPLKYSPQIALPPIFSSLFEVAIEPGASSCDHLAAVDEEESMLPS